MNILFFGMTGLFSKIAFEYVISTGINIQAVIIPAENPKSLVRPRRIISRLPEQDVDLPLLTPFLNETIIHLAWQNKIPVWAVGPLSQTKTMAWLGTLYPDLICIACFPYRFPPNLLTLPKYGCINLHPSLLPAYRGPTPLFWICRQGERRTGVTLHFLDEGLDSGDIIAQTSFDLPAEMTEAALTHLGASSGGRLLATAIKQADQSLLPHHPQPIANQSYFPAPSEKDFRIPITWSAERAFRFLRGANSWPLWIELDSGKLTVEAALSYEAVGSLDKPYQIHSTEIWVQFSPGILKVKKVGHKFVEK